MKDYNSALDEILRILRTIQKENGKIELLAQQPEFDNGDRNKEILAELKKAYNIDNWEYSAMLDQLIADKIIRNKQVPQLTLKGLSFEGYVQKEINSTFERNKEKKAEWMISRGAILAAIFSGCILLLELLKFFLNLFEKIFE